MFETRSLIKNILMLMLLLIFISISKITAQSDSTNNGGMSGNSSNYGSSGSDMSGAIEKRASDLTSDLQSKVNLTDSQVSAVKSDLIDYMTKVTTIQNSQRAGLKEKMPSDTSSMSGSSSDNGYSMQIKNAETDASSKIESVITDDQRSKWSEVRDSWWGEVKSVVMNNSMGK